MFYWHFSPQGCHGGEAGQSLPGGGEASSAPQRPDGGAPGLGPESEHEHVLARANGLATILLGLALLRLAREFGLDFGLNLDLILLGFRFDFDSILILILIRFGLILLRF